MIDHTALMRQVTKEAAMPFDEMGMSGEGTLKEYFTQGTYEFDLHQHVDRLQLELFSKLSGLEETDTMKIFWTDEAEDPYFKSFDDDDEAEQAIKAARTVLMAKKDQPGLVMLGIQPDDPILALFKDGEPIAAFYASYRGIYQAGGYVASERVVDHRVKTDKHYFAHDFLPDLPQNEWIEDYEAVCSEIAREFLLGERTR